jgi:hypothetical protein
MITKSLKPIAWALAAGILLLLTTTTGGAFVHEVQHAAHHTAGMHATGLCAWMCATAGGVISPAFQPAESAIVYQSVVIGESRAIGFFSPQRLQARAPPILL